MSKTLSEMFKGDPQFKTETTLDKYLLGVDNKAFLEMYLKTSGWSQVSKDVRQACYLNNYKKDKLHVWDRIESESYRGP